MAYITCKHCGCQMSDKSEACPVCGASVIEDNSQKEDTVAISNNNNDQESVPSKTRPKHRNRFLWIGIAFVTIIIAVAATISIINNNKEKQAAEQLRIKHQLVAEQVKLQEQKREEEEKQNEAKEAKELDSRIRSFIESFVKMTETSSRDLVYELYAPRVKRYASAYDKDVDYVADCYSRYDEKFGVYGKHSSVRWNTVSYNKSNNGITLTYIEDYSIDRIDPSKYSIFVLEKHFELNENFQIVSVYDVQLSKSKKPYSEKASMREFDSEDNGWGLYVVIDGTGLRLRLGPSIDAETFKWPDGTNRHPKVGDKFLYLGESGDFYKIDFNGNELWVSKQYTHIAN